MKNKSACGSVTTEFHVKCCGVPEEKLIVIEGIENASQRRWSQECVPPIPTTHTPRSSSVTHILPSCLYLQPSQENAVVSSLSSQVIWLLTT